MKSKVIIADDNKEFAVSLKNALESTGLFEVTDIALDGKSAVEICSGDQPDIMLLDIILPGLDGYGVLSELKARRIAVKTICLSQVSEDSLIEKAFELGASYIMIKPVNTESLIRRMTDLVGNGSGIKKVQPRKAIDEKLSNIFISVGIPAHIKGYTFLREAIKLTIDSPEIINSITKKLYPAIAERYFTSPSKVERAIRHAIEVAWSRGKIENINGIFGIKVYDANDKPTNGEFIALVADKMMTEGVFR